MSTKVSRPKGSFKAAPEGLHPAVCCDVWEIWTEQRREDWGGGLQDKTRIVWQIDKTYKDDDGKTRIYEVSQIYTASLHEKAKLRQHLESWRGRKFSEEELNSFELENLLGANCQLQVIHNIKDNGDTYANVQAVVPRHKSMDKLDVSPEFVRRKDRKKDDTQSDGEGPMEGNYDDDDVPF